MRPSARQRPGTNIGGLDHEPIFGQSVGVGRREVLPLHRGPPRESPRRCAHRLATAIYPDGSTPEVIDVVRTATFLFGAGQETTAKLLTAAMRVLGDRPDIQQQLRDDRSLIPVFIEECLRMDSPVKSVFRMARKSTTLGDTAVPGRHHGDGQPRRGQPRSEPVRAPARVPARPQERPRAHRVQPRYPLLPRRAAGPRGGPGQHRADSRPAGRHHHRRGEARSRRSRATTTSRRSSCAASPKSTSGSRPHSRERRATSSDLSLANSLEAGKTTLGWGRRSSKEAEVRKFIAAPVVACGLLSAPLPFAGEASAFCDSADCVPERCPQCRRGWTVRTRSLLRLRPGFRPEPTLICAAQGMWVRGRPVDRHARRGHALREAGRQRTTAHYHQRPTGAYPRRPAEVCGDQQCHPVDTFLTDWVNRHGAGSRYPRATQRLAPLLATHVKNSPSGAWATSPSWAGHGSPSFLTPCISGERNHRGSYLLRRAAEHQPSPGVTPNA